MDLVYDDEGRAAATGRRVDVVAEDFNLFPLAVRTEEIPADVCGSITVELPLPVLPGLPWALRVHVKVHAAACTCHQVHNPTRCGGYVACPDAAEGDPHCKTCGLPASDHLPTASWVERI